MEKFDDFYQAWAWLNKTTVFEVDGVHFFQKSLYIEVVKVNPKTSKIDDDETKNTKIEVWLECGEPFKEKGRFFTSHNPDYDCGGDTFEEAIIILANRVCTCKPEKN